MATRMKYRRSVGPLFLRRTTKATLTTQSPFHFPFHIRRVEWSVSLQKPQHIRAYIYHVPARCFPVSALFQSQTCARPRIGNGWLGSMRDISLREAPHDILRCFVDFRQQRLWDFAIRFDEVTTICGFWLFWIYSDISWYMLLCCVVKAVAVVSAGPLTYSSFFFFLFKCSMRSTAKNTLDGQGQQTFLFRIINLALSNWILLQQNEYAITLLIHFTIIAIEWIETTSQKAEERTTFAASTTILHSVCLPCFCECSEDISLADIVRYEYERLRAASNE